MISSKTILWRLETRKTAVIPDIGQEASHSKISDLTLHLTYTLYLKVDIGLSYKLKLKHSNSRSHRFCEEVMIKLSSKTKW